ncbi:MAG: helix-turn-helix domain-containing protein [Planctomycetes bacterium]|nr:helix-turn-helix domain-containing protein [Planctomycetota bacterium]
MTKQEACAYLRVSIATLNRLIRAGLITGSKLGQGVRFTPSDLEMNVKSAAIVPKTTNERKI